MNRVNLNFFPPFSSPPTVADSSKFLLLLLRNSRMVQLLLCIGSDPLRTLLLLIWVASTVEDADTDLFFVFSSATPAPLRVRSSVAADAAAPPHSVLIVLRPQTTSLSIAKRPTKNRRVRRSLRMLNAIASYGA